jgi:hypothetical protein
VIVDVPDTTGAGSEVVDTETAAVVPDVGFVTPLITTLTP